MKKLHDVLKAWVEQRQRIQEGFKKLTQLIANEQFTPDLSFTDNAVPPGLNASLRGYVLVPASYKFPQDEKWGTPVSALVYLLTPRDNLKFVYPVVSVESCRLTRSVGERFYLKLDDAMKGYNAIVAGEKENPDEVYTAEQMIKKLNDSIELVQKDLNELSIRPTLKQQLESTTLTRILNHASSNSIKNIEGLATGALKQSLYDMFDLEPNVPKALADVAWVVLPDEFTEWEGAAVVGAKFKLSGIVPDPSRFICLMTTPDKNVVWNKDNDVTITRSDDERYFLDFITLDVAFKAARDEGLQVHEVDYKHGGRTLEEIVQYYKQLEQESTYTYTSSPTDAV